MMSCVPPDKVDVSIVIPAKNEEPFIKKCLTAVTGQQTCFSYEILVIDSGSVDLTLQIVKEFPRVKLLSIRPEEFGHGKTRNLGARKTSGNYIVFLNADAIPVNRNWLARLIDRLARDENLGGVYSRHVPRNDCYQYMVRDLTRSMPAKPEEISRARGMDSSLFSTVSAAISRRVWEACPFDEKVAIAEDQKWAREVLNRGYRIRYEPDSMVVHSHNYSCAELFRVKKRVGRVLRRFPNRVFNFFPGLILILGGLVVKIAGDAVYIVSKRLSFRQKCRELGIALISRVCSFSGKFAGWIQS